MKIFINLLLFLFVCKLSFAQIEGVMGRIKSTTDGFKGGETSGRKDSAALGFERRDDRKDSLNLTFRVLDSIRNGRLDSIINDFDRYFSVPSSYIYLGNNGAAANSLIFKCYHPFEICELAVFF